MKYRYVLLVALAGLALMLLPAGTEEVEPAPAVATEVSLESRLETILSRIDGAGEVKVVLTEDRGGEVFYQTEGEDGEVRLGNWREENGISTEEDGSTAVLLPPTPITSWTSPLTRLNTMAPITMVNTNKMHIKINIMCFAVSFMNIRFLSSAYYSAVFCRMQVRIEISAKEIPALGKC